MGQCGVNGAGDRDAPMKTLPEPNETSESDRYSHRKIYLKGVDDVRTRPHHFVVENKP